jgi:multiple sugar transport system permease protein
MVSTSLKPDREIYATGGGGSAPTLASLLPQAIKWSNYAEALATVPLGDYLRNTIFLCIVSIIGAISSSSLVAYGFSKLTFWGRDVLFVVMLGTMALPGQVTMIPVFTLFKNLGWYGTYLPLIVPAFFASPFLVFLLTQFFRTLPTEMLEAGRVDGATEWRIFIQLVIPLSKPALATCTLFVFLGTWNEFFGPLLYINDPTKYTLAYGLQQFLSNYGGAWSYLMAAATLFTLPILVLFFFAQKTFIQGISTTGGK